MRLSSSLDPIILRLRRDRIVDIRYCNHMLWYEYLIPRPIGSLPPFLIKVTKVDESARKKELQELIKD